jgi:serine/threonine protein kinase
MPIDRNVGELTRTESLANASASAKIRQTDPAAPTVTGDAPQSDTILSEQPGLVGTMIDGRYFIEKELGHGGVGVVYFARDRKLLNKPVVVKLLLEQSLRHERLLQKFQQEKEALTRVDHPGIIGILDTGELPDGKPYLVMQYVDGATLRSAIPPDGMGFDRAARLIKQIGSALGAAHDKGILHRDLKPENVMLQVLSGGDEQIRIIDFGIAKIKDSIVASSTVAPMTAGTYWYMSPEQFRAERIGPASDIYSIGVIAYEMVTGRRPFNAETVSHLAELHREGVRVRPKDLRPALPEVAQNIILKAVSVDPRMRFQSAREFGDELAAALLGDLEDAPRERLREADAQQLSQTVGPAKARRRWPITVAVSAVILLIIGVAGVVAWNSFHGFASARGGADKPPPSAPTAPARSFNYWLTVQKMRDDKPYDQPFQSSGKESFENGYKFQLSVASTQSGYLYMLNEGAAENGATSFTMIYPTPVKSSPKLEAGQTIQTGWNRFGGQPGAEQFWIVLSAAPVSELEAAKDAVFKSETGGRLADAALARTVREFLIKRSEPKLETIEDTHSEQATVRGNGDVLVKLVELKHR